MVGGYDELTPPSRFYRGPITGTTPTYGYPYTADHHCASCGSTDISKPSCTGYGLDLVMTYKCKRCGRLTTRSTFLRDEKEREAVYEIRVNGHVERESLRLEEIDQALWEVLTDLDAHYASEKASQYYGSYYDGLMDGDSVDQGEALALESDILWINKDQATMGGYVDGLGVGEEYNLPDFPVTVVRLENVPDKTRRRPFPTHTVTKQENTSKSVGTGKAPSKKKTRPKTASKCVKAGKTPSKVKREPAKKATVRKPATKAASRRR